MVNFIDFSEITEVEAIKYPNLQYSHALHNASTVASVLILLYKSPSVPFVICQSPEEGL